MDVTVKLPEELTTVVPVPLIVPTVCVPSTWNVADDDVLITEEVDIWPVEANSRVPPLMVVAPV